MSQHVTGSQRTPRTTTASKPLPPAGLRPPAPPWAKLISWGVLLLCLILLAGRGPLLIWAAAQPLVELPLPGKPVSPTLGESQGFARVAGMGALLVRGILQPPGVLVVEGLAALGLVVIGLELSAAALLLMLQTTVAPRQGRRILLVRIPNRPTARVSETGADLFRALHRQLPASTPWLGLAPWITMTLSARPDEPVELGVVVAGGTAKQRASWAAAIRKTVQGLAPDAVVETRPDPLEAALVPGHVATWTEWQPALPPSYPLRRHDDHATASLLGPLVAALQPRTGVAYTELQLALRPRPDDTHLARGWRAAGLRRLLRLLGKHEYALTPDARALEAKLAGPTYDATLRAVSVATDASQVLHARAELDELNAVLGQYAARSGSRLQRWVRGAGGSVRADAGPRWGRGVAGSMIALVAGLLLGLGAWFGMDQPLPTFSGAAAGRAALAQVTNAAASVSLLRSHQNVALMPKDGGAGVISDAAPAGSSLLATETFAVSSASVGASAGLASQLPILTDAASPAAAAALGLLLPLCAGLLGAVGIERLLHTHARRQTCRLCARPLRATPLPGLLWGRAWRGPAILGADELAGLWHLPTPAQGRLVRWLPSVYLPPPPHAFCASSTPAAPLPAVHRLLALLRRGWSVACSWHPARTDATHAAATQPPLPVNLPERLVIGFGRHRDDSEAPVGIPLRDARQGLAFTAPPGVGKTQLASNLADQLRPCGYTLIDGKGDDAGNLAATMRTRIPLADEARLVVLDVLDDWIVGLNPLAEVDLSDPAGVDQVLGQIEAIFARLDPETWAKAPRMKNYLRKATLLVLAGAPHPTIAHVKQALLDQTYRERLLPHCRNVEVRDFWTVEFPQIGEQQRASRDALVSRFDMLLDSELTRYLFNQVTPAFSFREAIAEKLIVLAPLPHRTLGGLAGPVGMLLFQGLMRAAFSRPGSDLTRPEYGFIGDEFQVLVENCDTKDVRDALTQVRAFGIVTIIANQLHKQLGDLADYALTAISNRILLRTQEPDATLYARHYAESGITPADIAGQEPREHQYAWIGVHGRLTRLFSLRPLPWQPPLELSVPVYEGEPWQQLVPPDSPTPDFDRAVCALMYETDVEREAIAEALARSDDERWAKLLARWDAIRAFHRAHILANPGCIPDTAERQRWLSRLRAARPRVLAMAEYARVRQVVTASAGAPVSQRGGQQSVPPPPVAVSGGAESKPTQQPRFSELDQRQASRLQRAEPDDMKTARPSTNDDGAEVEEGE